MVERAPLTVFLRVLENFRRHMEPLSTLKCGEKERFSFPAGPSSSPSLCCGFLLQGQRRGGVSEPEAGGDQNQLQQFEEVPCTSREAPDPRPKLNV